MSTYYKQGDHNVICDICGWKYKRSQLRYNSDGLLVCNKDWESKHPLDFIRNVLDNPSVKDVRSEGTDVFEVICSTNGRSAVADYGTANCALADMSFIQR